MPLPPKQYNSFNLPKGAARATRHRAVGTSAVSRRPKGRAGSAGQGRGRKKLIRVLAHEVNYEAQDVALGIQYVASIMAQMSKDGQPVDFSIDSTVTQSHQFTDDTAATIEVEGDAVWCESITLAVDGQGENDTATCLLVVSGLTESDEEFLVSSGENLVLDLKAFITDDFEITATAPGATVDAPVTVYFVGRQRKPTLDEF